MSGLDPLFEEMVRRKASDLYLTAGLRPMLRIDGSIRALATRAISHEQMLGLLKELAPKAIWEEFSEARDTDFAYTLEGQGRFRANYFRDIAGVGAVFRLVPSQVPSAESLGLPPVILDLCRLTRGMVLVTGPTGSGKSTTLAAMIDHINGTRAEHIITIEDPVEFVHEQKRCLIHQREVHTHTASFRRALTAALREAPDIILCGELRDLETVEIALEMAETGHLVLGTLHTMTAAGAVDRIIDQFPPVQQAQIRTLLASTLKGVVAQTLLRKVGGGRVAALETLLVDDAVGECIRTGRTHEIPRLVREGSAKGMRDLTTALMDLVRAGTVEPEEAWMKAVDKDAIVREYQREGIPLPGAVAAAAQGAGPDGSTGASAP